MADLIERSRRIRRIIISPRAKILIRRVTRGQPPRSLLFQRPFQFLRGLVPK